MNVWRFSTLALQLLALLTLGCGHRGEGDAAAKLLEPYPKGGWRLARHELDNVVLTYSQILVLHAHSTGDGNNLRAPGWVPDTLPARSRADAHKRAAALALEARAGTRAFAELARTSSDDVVTREQGGFMGTWSALLVPAEFLDAFQAMKPGQVSRVVETGLGFHVLALHAAPPEQRLSGRRIVVAYAKTVPFDARSGRSRERTRAQALALARELSTRARNNPGDFAKLVQAHSDDRDAASAGSMGLLSTHRAMMQARESAVLAGLGMGQVSDPVDGPSGFSILIRDPLPEQGSLPVDAPVGTLLTTLPSRDTPDVAALLRNAPDSKGAAAYVAALHARLGPGFGLELSDAQARDVNTLVRQLAEELAKAEPQARELVLSASLARIKARLGAPAFDAYQRNLMTELKRDLIR
jgi:hypothetical protein